MAGQKTAAVVALVQKQSRGIAFVETQLEADAILANLKPLRRGFAQNQLRRRLGRGRAPHLPRQDFVIRPARGKNFCEPRQFFPLFGAQRLFGLRKQEFPQPFDIPARPAIARAVNHAESVRFLRVNQRGAQRQARIGVKIRGRAKRHRLARCRMGEGNFRRVQKHPRRRGAAVKRVAENRESALRRVDANLVCFSCQRFGFHTL